MILQLHKHATTSLCACITVMFLTSAGMAAWSSTEMPIMPYVSKGIHITYSKTTHALALPKAEVDRMVQAAQAMKGPEVIKQFVNGAKSRMKKVSVPVIHGKRLPAEIRDILISNLGDEKRFLCTAGIATESMHSPLFDPKGYWRGPVWAPPMAMICHGLRDSGAEYLARIVAKRYLRTIEQNGYYECHNPLTTEGLCHPFMPWTVAVYRELQRAFGSD